MTEFESTVCKVPSALELERSGNDSDDDDDDDSEVSYVWSELSQVEWYGFFTF